ncbi:MAG: DUF547 domain-containing protein [Candidatus Dadabacteria bacterium]|nr:MAG: DUF547 domain-containing protein [Candidatus Dadabacteria bacterium]
MVASISSSLKSPAARAALCLSTIFCLSGPAPPISAAGFPDAGGLEPPASTGGQDSRPGETRWRHEQWSALLGEFVTSGRVDYRGLLGQRGRLDRYLSALAGTSREEMARWSRADQVAFWINAYNAYTVRLILDHYPVDGIWQVTPLWRRALGGPFKLEFIPLGHLAPWLGKKSLSLDDIEHGVLRGHFREHRVHFAVVCASIGCPALRSQAYEGPILDRQLDDAARTFLADPTKNRYDASANVLYLSPIFDWFSEDFEPVGGPAGFFRRYGPPAARQALAAAPEPPAVRFTEYDWSLNER